MKIYLAVPYTHDDEDVVESRFETVTIKAGELLNEGHLVFSPITLCHPIAKRCSIPGNWEFWEEFDRNFIEWADEIWILMLDGWEESIGVNAEIKIANELGKLVRYVTP
jgi:hypothetical protein